MRIQVCTPTYIEAENIEEFLRRARAALPEADILVLDDNSPDGTADIAERVAAELGQIEVLRRPEKRGLGNAYRAGFAIGIARGYEVICQIDADLSHDPEVLPDLIAAVAGGADLAIGSRYGNRYTGFMLRTGVNDATAGYRAFRVQTLLDIDYAATRAKGYGFQIELAYRVSQAGGKIVEIPITFTDRVRGYSKMSMAVMVEEMALVSWWGIRDRLQRRRTT